MLKGWQIDNGQTTSSLHSSWIPRVHPSPPIYNPQVLPEGGGDPPVAEVICAGEGRWSDSKLRHWFDPSTCRAIKDIPLPRQDVTDRLIWNDTADGIFTVKLAYHLAILSDKRRGRWRSMVSWMDRSSWIRLWEANIPPKLKVFVWQILNRILPTTEALIEKGVPVLPRFPVCWAESETMEHLFFYCLVAHALWDYSELEYLGRGLPRHTFPLFFKRLMSLIHQPTLFMEVVAVLWRIWRSRNWVIFEGKQFGIPALMRQFNQQVEDWIRLPVDPVLQAFTPAPTHLSPRGSSSVVCMWDGATWNGSHAAGGMVLMTPTRELLWLKGFSFPV
ncbi:unnamed protein product [Linum trigynum]|uniref:Reverse transcriptase zinc-binding domain-containing protein n=1 Tax=Linum trigynum TaxID=586398 RepID=A0AAV2G6A9_9ROSI